MPRRFIGGSNNFYPRSPCGERRQHYGSFRDLTVISIHALLAESDQSRVRVCQAVIQFLSTLSLRRATAGCYCKHKRHEISIHALLAESDCRLTRIAFPAVRFLSTLSLRRATGHEYNIVHNRFISIHALLAESDLGRVNNAYTNPISIHALLAESDLSALWMVLSRPLFLSTLSLRRATLASDISILSR